MEMPKKLIAFVTLLVVVVGILPFLIDWIIGTPRDPTLDRRECPHHWEFKRLPPQPIASPITDIPEFHDCQRFILADNARQLRYDSLYAIFASFRLDTLEAMLDTLDAEFGTGRRAMAAAEVYTEGGRYDALGIKTNYSCLYLFRRPGWRALMVPVPQPDNPSCDEPIDPGTLSGRELEVRRTSFPGFHDDDYPPVARWDWDTVNLQQYIGIKCGVAWCEVGNPGFISSDSYPDSPAKPIEFRRTRVIKGWYDEQWLATASGGAPQPTRVKGTIFPDQALGELNSPTSFFSKPAVAHIALTGNEADYKTKFNLDPASVTGAGLNTMLLCYGSRFKCLGLWWHLNPWLSPRCGPGSQWYATIIGTDGSKKNKCVTQRPAPTGIHVPATSRWRWLATDETTWKRCTEGCCEVH